MTVSTAKCRRVWDSIPAYPGACRPSEVARRTGMDPSSFRSILVQATFMYPICEDENGRLSRFSMEAVQ